MRMRRSGHGPFADQHRQGPCPYYGAGRTGRPNRGRAGGQRRRPHSCSAGPVAVHGAGFRQCGDGWLCDRDISPDRGQSLGAAGRCARACRAGGDGIGRGWRGGPDNYGRTDPGWRELRPATLAGFDAHGREIVSFEGATHSARVGLLPLADRLMFLPAVAENLPAGALVEFRPFC